MAACPEGKYAALLKTPDGQWGVLGGLTPEQPFTLVPNVFAMSEWFAIADRVITRGEAAFRAYSSFKAPEEWTAEENARWNQLKDEWYAVKERYDNVESPWNILDWTHASAGSYITDLVNVSVDAACMWQQFDVALEGMGGKPPGPPDPDKLPKPGMSIFEKALWVGGFVAGGAALLYVAGKVQNRKAT